MAMLEYCHFPITPMTSVSLSVGLLGEAILLASDVLFYYSSCRGSDKS